MTYMYNGVYIPDRYDNNSNMVNSKYQSAAPYFGHPGYPPPSPIHPPGHPNFVGDPRALPNNRIYQAYHVQAPPTTLPEGYEKTHHVEGKVRYIFA